MKSLTEYMNESLITERYSASEEKLFWKWIDDLGGTDMIDEINRDEQALWKKAYELGTTKKQFEKFVEIFFDLTSAIRDIIADSDSGLSDDGCDYASWSAPFYGQKKYEKSIKDKDWKSICDEYEGEHCGYAMNSYFYEDYMIGNKLNNPKGYK